MEENQLEELLKEIIVLDDKGVACFDKGRIFGYDTNCGEFVPIEPHCIECGCRLMNDNVLCAFGYITVLADHCKNESDYCVCEEKGDKKIEQIEGEKK